MAYTVRAVREQGTWLVTVPEVPEVVVRASNLDKGVHDIAIAIGAYVSEDEAQVDVVVDFRASSPSVAHGHPSGA